MILNRIHSGMGFIAATGRYIQNQEKHHHASQRTTLSAVIIHCSTLFYSTEYLSLGQLLFSDNRLITFFKFEGQLSTHGHPQHFINSGKEDASSIRNLRCAGTLLAST
jgi:hypothetical protein